MTTTNTYSQTIEKFRKIISNIIRGEDKRLLIIVGPCSIHSKEEALKYATLLKQEQEKYKDTLFFVMRTYFQKPRTTIGWEGFSVDPYLDSSYQFKDGIKFCQEICEELTKLDIPLADEALNMELTDKWKQYLSYAALGARNSEDQNMRKYCSNLPCPIGVKHPRSGNLKDGVNSVLSVQHKGHTLFYKDTLHTCTGNEFAHIILRGNSHKLTGNNISKEHIEEINTLFTKHNISNPAIICDLSHDNSRIEGVKQATNQLKNIELVLELLQSHNISSKLIRGVMIESHIEHGKQSIKSPHHLQRGVSITDECINFKQTQEIFERLHTYQIINTK
ncbi:MAG: 3-deoxy-7-phosphoheptulonate synthase [Candidatus Woesearchaeota archaeon]